MKTTLCLMLAVVLLAGCNPQEQAGPAAPKQKVEGAFGFKLGEQLPQKYEVSTNDCYLWATVDLEESEKPFRWLHLSVTADRKIYEISAETGRIDSTERGALQKEMSKALETKYGRRFETKLKGEDEFQMFGNAERDVTLKGSGQFLSVVYQDERLAAQVDAAVQAARTKAAQKL